MLYRVTAEFYLRGKKHQYFFFSSSCYNDTLRELIHTFLVVAILVCIDIVQIFYKLFSHEYYLKLNKFSYLTICTDFFFQLIISHFLKDIQIVLTHVILSVIVQNGGYRASKNEPLNFKTE